MATAPKFVEQLHGDTSVQDGEEVLIECKINIPNDPDLKIEWRHNGRPVIVASRHEQVYEDDYVALDIMPAYAADSGVYSCKIQNSAGTDQTEIEVSISDPVNPVDSNVILTPEGYQAILELENFPPLPDIPDPIYENPKFVQELTDITDAVDGDTVIFEAKVEPNNDPDLKVEWYLNDSLLELGSRFKLSFDFGYIALQISPIKSDFSGNYLCRVYNKGGEATSSAVLTCQGEGNILSDTNNPSGLEKIKQLESYMDVREWKHDEEEAVIDAPSFKTQIQPLTDLMEGQNVSFTGEYVPESDDATSIEWFVNDVPLLASNRIGIFNENGTIALNIVGVKPEDSGTYVCKITNASGEASTQAALDCKPDRGIVKTTILPQSLKKIRQLESWNHPQNKLAQRRMQNAK